MNSGNDNERLFPLRPSIVRDTLWIVSIALVYFTAARLSLLLIIQPEGIAAIWPPEGIFLSAILLTRRDIRPALVGVLFIADLIAEVMAGTPFFASFIYALALSGEAVFSSWLLLRFVKAPFSFQGVRDVVAFLFFAVILSNALSSSVAAAAATTIPGTSFWNAWLWWATSDGIGNLLVTPFILSWASLARTGAMTWKPKRVAEGAALFVSLAVLHYIAFRYLSEYSQFSLLYTYLTFPFLLWAAFRFGLRGVASALVVLAAIAIYFTMAGYSINISRYGSSLDAVIVLQLSLAVMAIPLLFLTALIIERKHAERNMHHLAEIVQSSDDAIIGKDLEGTITSWNKGAEKIYGYPEQEMIGNSISVLMPPDRAHEMRLILEKIRTGSPVEHYETVRVRKDGRTIPVSVTVSPIRDSKGMVVAASAIARDIIERKRAEETLRRLNRALRAISNCNQTLMRAEDEQPLLNDICRIVCDEAGYRMAWVGYAEKDDAKTVRPVAWAGVEEGYLPNAGMTWADTEHGRGPTGTAIRSGKSACIQDFTTDPQAAPWREGALLRGYRSNIALPLKDERENIFGVITIYSTEPNAFTADEIRLLEELAGNLAFGIVVLRTRIERNHTENLLRKREAELNESQRIAHIGSWDWDLVNDVIWWSDEYYRISGRDPSKPAPNYVEHLKAYTRESAERLDTVMKRAMKIGEPYEVDLELAEPTSSTRWIIARGEVKRDKNGKIRGLRGTAQDITERKWSEEILREREAFIRNILESVDEGFIVVDQEYRILSANRAFCNFAKLPEANVVGRLCYDVSHHVDKPCFETGVTCPVKRTFETGTSHSVTHTQTDTAGAKRYVEMRSYPITGASGTVFSVIETMNDITEKRKLEEQLGQAQKLESVGQLAGGIAHDFNNVLAAIVGYSNILQMKMQPDDPCLVYTEQILAAAERASGLTQSLLAFSRKQVINPRNIDLNVSIRKVEKFLSRIIGEDISLTMSLCDRSLTIFADAIQIEQILMNLATNARDAMPKGGVLMISTEQDVYDAAHAVTHNFGEPGSYAVLSVSDTGTGMDEQTRAKIFDPFFTTKDVGRGTGLGLAIVYGVVKQNNGQVNVYSEVGKGTTFKIYFPLVEASAEAPHVATVPATIRGGSETILLVEDDKTIRELCRQVLSEYGYRVIEAENGEAALKMFQDHIEAVQLIITDVIMPKKSGRDFYDEVSKRKLGVKVIFTSGYPSDLIRKEGVLNKETRFISKPSSPQTLLQMVREVLDQPAE